MEHQSLSVSSLHSSKVIPKLILVPLVAEGIMTLHDPALRSLYDLKVFDFDEVIWAISIISNPNSDLC